MDRTSLILVIILSIAFIAVILFAVIRMLKQRRKTKDEDTIVNRGKKSSIVHNNMMWLYRLYRNTPFLNKYFVKIRKKVAILYPSDTTAINKKTTQILTKGTLVGIAGIIFSIFISEGDVFFICSGFLVTYILITSTVSVNIKKIDNKLLDQFSQMLSKVRHCYNNVQIVEVALSLALDELPYEIGLHAQTIKSIITDANMKQRVEEYIGTEPNQYMLMFLSICSSIKEFGDKKLADGSSLFLKDLNYLKEEVNNEIIAKRKNTAAFKALPVMAVIPVIAIKPIEFWARSNIAEIAQFYEGLYGIVAMVLIFIVSFICYTMIISLRDGEQEVEKESDLFARLAANEYLSPILNRIISQEYTKYMRYDSSLRGMGNHTGPKAFCLKRILIGIATLISVIVVFITADITQRMQTLNNWTNEFADTIVPNEEYRQIMQETGKDYINVVKNNPEIDQTALANDIKRNTKVTKEIYAEQIASAIMKRLQKHANTYFKWYFMIISILCGIMAYNLPVWLLKYKKSIVDMRKEEEVIQFQSLMLILMHINGTTLQVILEWMERFSYCFKESIVECRIQLCNGAQKTLIDMKDKEDFEPFRDFIDNLIAIDKVGVEKAFDEIQTERDYYLKKREQDREENKNKKSSRGRRLAIIPAGLEIFIYLITPMGMYAYNMLLQMKDIIGQ